MPAGIRRCLFMHFLIRQSGSDFSSELESFPGSEDGDDFIDDGGNGNGTLYECRKLWSGIGQYATYNPGKDQGDSGVWQKGKAQVFLNCFRHVGCLCSSSCAKVFSETSGDNIYHSEEACSEDQVKVKRSAEIHNGCQKADPQDGMKPFCNFLKLHRGDHVREYGRVGMTCNPCVEKVLKTVKRAENFLLRQITAKCLLLKDMMKIEIVQIIIVFTNLLISVRRRSSGKRIT